MPASGAAGLLSHHETGKGAYLLRVGGSKSNVAAGQVQLARIANGKTEILAQTAVGTRYDGSKLQWQLGEETVI